MQKKKLKGLRGKEAYSSIPPHLFEARHLRGVYVHACEYGDSGGPVCPTCGIMNARTVKYGVCKTGEADMWRISACLTENCRTIFKSFFDIP